jgi:hypothetical protein
LDSQTPVTSASSEYIKGDTMKKYQLHLLTIVAIALAAGIGAQAQIIGQIEANIPFQFHAGGAKFPAGKYVLRVEEGSDLGTMEIQSYDGHSSALFEIRDAQAATSPQKTELVFNHVGNRYFLSKIFDQGNKAGSAVVATGYAKKYGADLKSGEEAHIAAQPSSKSMD